MKVIETIAEMRKIRRELNGTVGFVPTMGYLHEGHLSLVKRSREADDYTIASIFVNPSQFGPEEDFECYPRDYARDFSLLEKEQAHFLFMPQATEMYPEGFDTWVDVGKVTELLEGAIRPGHFRGVATVVTKLFNIVNPTRAYFGQKDAQQCVVIRKMVKDLNINLEMIIVPTVREPDGLAMSSRNVYLAPEERQQARVIYEALRTAHAMWVEGGRDPEVIKKAMLKMMREKPLATVDYISIASPQTLEELEWAEPHSIVSLAVRFGKTRLIDNLFLE